VLEIAGSFTALLALALVLYDVAGRKEVDTELTTRTQRHEGADRPLLPIRHSALGNSSLLWLLLLFLADGLVMVAALIFRKELPLSETMPFQTILFVSAFLVTTVFYYLREPRLSPDTLKWGALLGTANFGNYLFLVLALTVLPGIAVYPVIAAGEVGLMAIAGVVLWKEQVGIRSWLGIALAVISVVLIQFGKGSA